MTNVSHGWSVINKFGWAPDADKDDPTDVWDGADGATGTKIWVAPTQARKHDIVSAAAADDGAPVGTGMRTVRVLGLTDWDTKEVSEDVILNGATPVATVNTYVIIHRLIGLTFGSGGTNAGIIKATAQVDGTVTAMITAGHGQTCMAIFGVPSPQTLLIRHLHATVLRSKVDVKVDVALLANERPDQADSGFVMKLHAQFGSNQSLRRPFVPALELAGPLIVKLQATTDTNDSEVTAAFDAHIAEK